MNINQKNVTLDRIQLSCSFFKIYGDKKLFGIDFLNVSLFNITIDIHLIVPGYLVYNVPAIL